MKKHSLGPCLFVVSMLTLGVNDFAAGSLDSKADPIRVDLNGLTLSLDSETGSLLQMEYPGVGKLLEAAPDRASLIDLAFPIPEFEPLRLASRFSHGAVTQIRDGEVTVEWSELGASRDFEVPGEVAATVRLREATDGRSIILTCTVTNHSPNPIRQVLFPDFMGLLPFAGDQATEFRSGGCLLKPFEELRTSDLDRFYATNANMKTLKCGDLNDTEMIIRWMDLGGLKGGFSLFPLRWGWDAQTQVILHLSDADHRLRLMNEHRVEIQPGEEWSSGEYWLTPHTQGWAKGIEPYRAWGRGHMDREYPLPDHVRDGLGFRSIWMCQNQPNDPQDAVWKFSDFPALAREAKEHGLEEMVAWIWHKPFTLPFPAPYPHLGTEEDFIKAIAECKEIGVNVAPFVSVLQAEKSTAERYGLTINPESGNWTYHTEFIPKFNPSYASRFACVQVDTTDPRWQQDVLDSCTKLIEMGVPSLCWDQYWSVEKEPNLNTLTSEIRRLAKTRDPQSTFSGEELKNFEIDSNYLDYTWNWGHHENLQALVSVFPAPRINVNINHSVTAAKRCFADNLYLNVWPMKPDSINGSDWISNDSALSRILKQCSTLRSRFLDYFTEGLLIGDCILSEPCPEGHVSAYVLPDRLLVIAFAESEGETLQPNFDLSPWLSSPSGEYRWTSFDVDGHEYETGTAGGGGIRLGIPADKATDLVLIEWKPS
ncbi:MAG: hypothetical protein H6751_17390 [Candidatus Omnitrophica bacterium]|nr:hypothetical protein [Candidatus Omnitrophota bacterium]